MAGPVTIRRPDGTVQVRPAYDADELARVLGGRRCERCDPLLPAGPRQALNARTRRTTRTRRNAPSPTV